MLHFNNKNTSNAVRGATSCVQWYDEFAFIPANSTVAKTAKRNITHHRIVNNTGKKTIKLT